MTGESLVVSLITDEAGLAALAPEWRAIQAAIRPRMPFHDPDWHIAWWRHFSRAGRLTRDSMRVFAVRGAAGALVAVAPMMVTQRPGVGPLRTRELQFFGADTNITELRGPICPAERLAEVMEVLAAEVPRLAGRWDWINWRGLRQDDRLCAWMRRHGPFQPMPETTDHFIVLPASWPELAARLSRNMKEAIRKCTNAPARDGHMLTFAVLKEPEAVAAAIEVFLRLHAARAAMTGGVRHIDAFATRQGQAFLRDHAAFAAERGTIRVFQLLAAGRIVAIRIGFVCGDELYLYYSGYEPAWGKYSVMTTVVVETVKWAILNRFAVVNLSTGSDRSKLRWQPEGVAYSNCVQVAACRRSQIAWLTIRVLRRWIGQPDYRLARAKDPTAPARPGGTLARFVGKFRQRGSAISSEP